MFRKKNAVDDMRIRCENHSYLDIFKLATNLQHLSNICSQSNLVIGREFYDCNTNANTMERCECNVICIKCVRCAPTYIMTYKICKTTRFKLRSTNFKGLPVCFLCLTIHRSPYPLMMNPFHFVCNTRCIQMAVYVFVS